MSENFGGTTENPWFIITVCNKRALLGATSPLSKPDGTPDAGNVTLFDALGELTDSVLLQAAIVHGGKRSSINVVKTMINHPFGNGLYNPFMVIQGMVYYCFNPLLETRTGDPALLCCSQVNISSLHLGCKRQTCLWRKIARHGAGHLMRITH